MGGSTSTGADHHAYRIYKVSADHIDCIKRKLDDDKTTTESPIAFTPHKSGEPKMEEMIALENGLSMGTGGKATAAMPQGTSAEFLFDKVLTASLERRFFDPSVVAQKLGPGHHQLVSYVSPTTGAKEVGYRYFDAGATTGPKIVRTFPLESGCQSHPT